MVKHYIDDECEWINNVVCCKKCKEPVHIAFFHDEPVSFCPKCNKMYYYPYSKELLVMGQTGSTQRDALLDKEIAYAKGREKEIQKLLKERGELKQKLQQEYAKAEKIIEETSSPLWREGARWCLNLIEELLK